MPFAFNYAVKSVTGLVRDTNQDSGYASANLLVVADGMGGHAGGDVASSIAIDVIEQLDHSEHTVQTALNDLEAALEQSRLALVRASELAPQLHGLGTTVVCLLRAGPTLFMAHLGDSRAYLLRDGELNQVTVDHTFVQHLIDMGRITPAEAETHPQRNVVMRVLSDFDLDLTPDVSVREARIGDRWLLCSDGASGFMSARQIAAILGSSPTPEAAADALVAAALANQSTDNVTCLVADIVPPNADRPRQVVKAGAAATGGPYPELVSTVVAEAARRVGDDEVVDDYITEEIWLVPPADIANANVGDPRVSGGGGSPVSPVVSTGGGANNAPTTAGRGGAISAPTTDGRVSDDTVPIERVAFPPGEAAFTSAETLGMREYEQLGVISGEVPKVSPLVIPAVVQTVRTEPVVTDTGSIEIHDDDPLAKPAPKPRPWLALAISLAVLATLTIGAWRAYAWTQTQYFLGVWEGYVTVFRGIPENIGPIVLNHPKAYFDTQVSQLPEFYLGRLGGSIRTGSFDEAVERGERLIAEALGSANPHGRSRG